MLKIILALTLSILILAGCGNIAPNNGEKNGSEGSVTAPSEKPVVKDKNGEEITLISEDEAKKIALEIVPDATEEHIRELKKDRDDGRWEYEIKIVYDEFEYEFEIDAETGEIISRDKESIYD